MGLYGHHNIDGGLRGAKGKVEPQNNGCIEAINQ